VPLKEKAHRVFADAQSDAREPWMLRSCRDSTRLLMPRFFICSFSEGLPMSPLSRRSIHRRSKNGREHRLSQVAAVAGAVLLGGCSVQAGLSVPAPVVYAPAAVVSVGAPEVVLTASEPPPPLPVYEQPPCPEEGFIWTPGNWQYASGGYFWVPGTWVQPPRVGVLWTPGYWGFSGGVYGFNPGYWGPHVGFYGGVNFGYGYGGSGFAGGRWDGGHFAYNTAVNNVNVSVVHNTYNETVVNNNVTINRTSYNGGSGGVTAAPTPQERVAAKEQHIAPTQAQTAHVREAIRTPALAAKVNGGHPAIAATARPAAFTGPGVVGAHGAAGREASGREESGKPSTPEAPKTAAHAQAEASHAATERTERGEPPKATDARAPDARTAHTQAGKPAVQPPHPAKTEQPVKLAHSPLPKPAAKPGEKKREPEGRKNESDGDRK
jgi:hypothetical protein